MPTEQQLIEEAIASGGLLRGKAGTVDHQHVYYEANGQPYNKIVGGGKSYIPPAAAMTMWNEPQAVAWAQSQGYGIKGGEQGLADSQKSYVDAQGYTRMPESPVTMADQGGGLFHTTGTWNSKTGQFDSSLDWGNILTMVVAGVMTAGVASAMMGGGVAAEAAASTAATTGSVDAGLAAGTAAAGGVLPSAAIAPTVGTLAPGLTGTAGLAAGVDASILGTAGAAGAAGAATAKPAAALPEVGLGAGLEAGSLGAVAPELATLPSTAIAPAIGELAPGLAGTPGLAAAADAGILSTAGPGLLGTLSTLGEMGSILGQASSSQLAAKQANDRLNTTLYGEQAAAENAAKKFALTAPGTRLKSSTSASLLNNYQPQSVAWGGPGSGLKGQMPTYSGGVPGGLQNLDPDTRALSQQVIKDQLLSQMKGGRSGENEDLKIPDRPNIGEESRGDKVLGGLATGLSLAGAAGSLFGKKK
jgi:hypothetical protein